MEQEGVNFYYVNECIMYSGVKFGSISPPCWNQPVLASLLSIFSLHILQEYLAPMCKI